VIPDRQQVLELLSDTLFDYRRVVILEKEPAPRPQTGPDSTPAGGVQIIQRSSDRLELKASCSRPSLLVLSEMFYPEWQARVDGRPAEILRADYCLRCVALPAGTHTVVLSYDRGPVLLGIVVSALTALGLGMTVVLTRRRRPGTR